MLVCLTGTRSVMKKMPTEVRTSQAPIPTKKAEYRGKTVPGCGAREKVELNECCKDILKDVLKTKL